jgi:hypothetical protein
MANAMDKQRREVIAITGAQKLAENFPFGSSIIG